MDDPFLFTAFLIAVAIGSGLLIGHALLTFEATLTDLIITLAMVLLFSAGIWDQMGFTIAGIFFALWAVSTFIGYLWAAGQYKSPDARSGRTNSTGPNEPKSRPRLETYNNRGELEHH